MTSLSLLTGRTVVLPLSEGFVLLCFYCWCLFSSFFCNHLAEEERADCFILLCLYLLFLRAPSVGLLHLIMALSGHTQLLFHSIFMRKETGYKENETGIKTAFFLIK